MRPTQGDTWGSSFILLMLVELRHLAAVFMSSPELGCAGLGWDPTVKSKAEFQETGGNIVLAATHVAPGWALP